MKRLFIKLFVMTLAAVGVAVAGQSAFDEANHQYRAGDFAGAASRYEKILTDEGPQASVYYNLGNAYQNIKRYGPAILAYERARLLTPRDPDLLANLALARKAAAAFDESGRAPRWEAVLDYLSRNEWSWLVASAAACLAALALTEGAMGIRRRVVKKVFLFVSVLATFVIICGSLVLWLRRDEQSKGVVLAEQATLQLSPFEKSETLGTPGPGKSVRILSRNGGYLYVAVPGTNLQGWLPDDEVQAIERPQQGRSVM